MTSWHPTATIAALMQRATVIQTIRHFFAERGVLEVETPALSNATVTDPHLHSITAEFKAEGSQRTKTLYLQTSPEFAMKRLLAAGSGPIYQICKSFRNGEIGRFHNPEFTMLEWYRPGFDHHALMSEMDALLQAVLHCLPAERLSYAEAFKRYLNLDPHTASLAILQDAAFQAGIQTTEELTQADRDTWLQLLMSHIIEPQLGVGRPSFIYDFPASQAALARVRHSNPPVAERFEVYIEGVELANGFHELADANEQEQRFKRDLIARQAMGYPEVPIDYRLIDALAAGFPDCAGVALGIDRLVMLVLRAKAIDEVISFTIVNA